MIYAPNNNINDIFLKITTINTPFSCFFFFFSETQQDWRCLGHGRFGVGTAQCFQKSNGAYKLCCFWLPCEKVEKKKNVFLQYWTGGFGIGLPLAMAMIMFISAMASSWVFAYAVLPGLLVPPALACCIAFVILADRVHRQANNDSVAKLSNDRYLRGVNLGLNIAGLLFMPIFTWVGVPLTMRQLSKRSEQLNGWKSVKVV